VLGQLRRDRRTLAMVFLVAPALLALFKYIFNNQPHTFDRIGAPMIGLFPLIMMFLITSIAMLRERTTGTLERLMSLPLAKLDLLVGYALAFALLAALQGGIKITADNTGTWLWLDIVIVAGSVVLALLLGATTLRRRTA
jgi:ABC-2 type transport system permease protein